MTKSYYTLNNPSLIHNRTMHFSFSLSLDHSKNTFWPTCKSSNQIDPSLNFYHIKLKKKKRQITRTALLYALQTWNYLVIYFVTLTLWFVYEEFLLSITEFDYVSSANITFRERNEEKDCRFLTFLVLSLISPSIIILVCMFTRRKL